MDRFTARHRKRELSAIHEGTEELACHQTLDRPSLIPLASDSWPLDESAYRQQSVLAESFRAAASVPDHRPWTWSHHSVNQILDQRRPMITDP
jgi:hypothetical protein